MNSSPEQHESGVFTVSSIEVSSRQILRYLILKDVYLHRWLIAVAAVGGIGALGLLSGGGEIRFYMGGVLLVTVLIGLGAGLAVLTAVDEHKEGTLPFLLSLPISLGHYAAAKILTNLLIFGTVWILLLLSSLGLVLGRDDLPNGLVVYVVVGFVEIFWSTCIILAVALVSQALTWTIGAIVAGNLVFNGFLFYLMNTPAFVSAAASPQVVWPASALSLLFAELLGIVFVLGIAYVGATRRKDIF